MRKAKFLPVVFIAVAVCSVYAHGSTPAVDKIQKAYEGIKDIKGSFVQKSTIKDLKRTDTFKGTFMIKMPAKMRWQYSDAKQSTEVIITNEELLIYQKNEKQVLKGRFDRQSYGQAPIALLSGFGNIDEEFDVSEKEGRVLLKPKRSMGTVASVEVAPSDGEFPISSLSIIDKRSNRIDIMLKGVTVNSGVKDSAFEFTVPQGVSAFEYK